ncbi:MAG: GntR family transcriptional regulator, partial [Halocynthiibacter sp.]
MDKTVLSKIKHPPATLRDMVQERMREAIIEGHFKPGDRLVERPLCEQLGV